MSMKKNRNGFTLVEILVTIGILAVLATIVGVSFTRIMHNNKTKEVDSFAKIIENAACAYVDYQGINKSLCDAYNDLCEVTYAELLNGKDNNFNNVDLKVDNDEENGFIKKTIENPQVKGDDKTVEGIVNRDPNAVAATVDFKNGETICEYYDLAISAGG